MGFFTARICVTPLAAIAIIIIAGCAAGSIYQIPLMPAPEVLEEGSVDPFGDRSRVSTGEDPEIPYATLRLPATPGDGHRFYSDRRAGVLRVGVSRVELGRSDITWDQARQISLLKNQTDKYPIQVAEKREFGALEVSRHPFLDEEDARLPTADREFAEWINARLTGTRHKDIFIYVHGYRVGFQNPLLVAAELWHFMGYEGVFIPFAWPSHRGRLAYFGDTESARYSSLFLRDFLEYLAKETDAERINILGYSAGTRLVALALYQIALLHRGQPPEQTRAETRLGDVILVGSDVDRGIFGVYLEDGLLHTMERLTLYESDTDKALGLSWRVFGSERVGQLVALKPAAREYLLRTDRLALISVRDAPDSSHGNGHSYFRDSPWVSSDVLSTLLHHLPPDHRGLVQDSSSGIWEFPGDYLARLGATLRKIYAAPTAGARP